MTHQHNSNGREWLMVEVPSEATDIKIESIEGMSMLTYVNGHTRHVTLINAVASIHSDSQTITEEQAAEIVDKVHIKNPEEWAYKNYVDGFKLDKIGVTVGYSRAIDSYESLLQSMGLEGKRVVNLKRA